MTTENTPEPSTNGPTQAPKPEPKPSAPALDEATVQRLAKEAAMAALQEQYLDREPEPDYEPAEISEEAFRKHLLNVLGGTESKQTVDPILQKFFENPTDVLALAADAGAKRALNEVAASDAEARQLREASMDVLKVGKKEQRSDILKNDAARQYIDYVFSNRTDTKKPVKERLAQAVKDYDLLCEEIGAGSIEDRVAKFASPGASAHGVPQDKTPSDGESQKNWLQSRVERRNRITRQDIS